MISNSIDVQLKFHRIFWFGIIVLFAIFLGYLLATDVLLMALGIAGLIWALLLPYHSKLSLYLSVSTYSSALIVPLFPGRPYMWEFAALLGWSGLVIMISMRQHAPDAWNLITRHRWMFVGLIGYCLVLLQIMAYRVVGFRILGSDQMGGRFYFQQLSLSILPFLFAFSRIDEKTITRLFIFQCILTGTYIISDFVFSVAPQSLWFLLQFFELPGDAVNFEHRAAHFGIRRFQSFFVVSSGLVYLLLTFFNLRDFTGKKGVYLIPVILAVLGIGTLGGHRFLLMMVGGVLLFCAIAQRFFNIRSMIAAFTLLVLAGTFTYTFAERLPLAAQRVVAFLPGISVDSQAKLDGEMTMEARRVLRKIGLDLAPQYYWLGRGFGVDTADYSYLWDPTVITSHVNQGRFFNGYVGLLVNTGIFGTLCMFLFLTSGTFLAVKVINHLRTYGCEDNFSRVCSVLAGLWVANCIAFIFFHGDSEYAMKTFSLQAGLLLACNRLLEKRLEVQAVE